MRQGSTQPGISANRRRFLAGLSALSVPGVLTSCVTPLNAARPDLILYDGEIHTVDVANRRVEAIAIAQGQIVAAGTSSNVRRLASAMTTQIPLDGRTVLPGINDSHLHLMGWALAQPPYALNVGYPNVRSIADVVEVVRQAVSTTPQGEWIVGRGWDQPYLAEERAPTAADLDAVAPDHPVVLTEFSGHAVWANTRALNAAGIDRNTDPGPGGVIVRDADGEPTGLLFEGPAFNARNSVPEPSEERKRTAIEAAMSALLARGITSATEPGLAPADIGIYQRIAGSTDVARMRMNCLVHAGTSVATLEAALAELSQLPGADARWAQTGGVKIMGDGIPTGNKTAWLHEPYEGGGNGSLLVAGDTDLERVEQITAMIRLIHRDGRQIGTHVTGDRSIDTVVAAYADAQRAYPQADPRHYLIHADLVSEATLAQMAPMGVGANFNPEIKFMIADSQVHSIGAERAAYEFPYRSALRAGVVVASSSDAPVTEGNWLQGIATCVERLGKQSGRVSGPEQRISLDAAIRSYTMAGAWQDHADAYKGSLEPGKVADLVVLDERLSSADTSSYATIDVAMTLVDGQLVHRDGV